MSKRTPRSDSSRTIIANRSLRSHRRHLAFEALESRDLLAVQITEPVNGDLHIIGDEESDNVYVEADEEAGVKIFKVYYNNSPEPLYTGTANHFSKFTIKLGDGENFVTIEDVKPENGFSASFTSFIETGDGVDSIWGSEFKDVIKTGGNTDYIWAHGGRDFIESGAGADVVRGEAGSDTNGT